MDRSVELYSVSFDTPEQDPDEVLLVVDKMIDQLGLLDRKMSWKKKLGYILL